MTDVADATGPRSDHEPGPAVGPMTVTPGPEVVEVLVIGSGFAGLGATVRLMEAGFDDVVVVEAGATVGGVWRDNTYPGAACDIPSVLYSFSFHPKPDWSRWYPRQPEIAAYLQEVADSHGVTPRIRFSERVEGAAWDDDLGRWRVTTTAGQYLARHLVSGMGGLSQPSIPALPGIADYRGPVWHTAAWDHTVDLGGKVVAVVGTGASAIQVVPALAPDVERLHLFQRTPPWVVPRHDHPISARRAAVQRRWPWVQDLVRAKVFWRNEGRFFFFRGRLSASGLAEARGRAYLAKQVPDEDLRRRITPTYRPGCKRILVSDDYYPTLGRPNVEVVTDPIVTFTAAGVRSADGVERPVDAVVLATGFDAVNLPFAPLVVGRGGRTLADAWAGGMEAYKGTTVAGFPNFYLLIGPNTTLGHNSMVYIIESQIAYVVDALRTLRDKGLAVASPRPEIQRQWNARLQRAMASTVWVTGGCHSWYQDPSGRISTLWPTFASRMRSVLRRFDPDAYDLAPAPRPPSPSSPTVTEATAVR